MNAIKYDKAFWIKFFGAIPEEKWISWMRHTFQNGSWGGMQDRTGVCCAIGHVEYHCRCLAAEADLVAEKMLNDLGKVLAPHILESQGGHPSWTVFVSINNAPSTDFPQKTPKQRIMAALEKAA